ncbi:MAG: M1 family peptidase, partial [Candidatus Eisenbacteria bacterium]|nr:M1 family peptidase [Candidatus Eisenbacteria bacterium]
MKRSAFLGVIALCLLLVTGSAGAWQQAVHYTIDATLNVGDGTILATESLSYTNNSPENLSEVFFHLYLNAVRPGSRMDERARSFKM